MDWKENELQSICYKKFWRLPNNKMLTWFTKSVKIPIPYAQIVHQFTFKDHGKTDMGHKSLHHKTYAQVMLDEFGKELDSFEGAAGEFHSKVLTPVLQHLLYSVPDAYGQSI